MKLNLKKTWEMVIQGKTSRPLPEPLPIYDYSQKLVEVIRCNVPRKSYDVRLANERVNKLSLQQTVHYPHLQILWVF